MATKWKERPASTGEEAACYRIGLLGCGTVGSGVLKMLRRREEALYKQSGAKIEVEKILVRDIRKQRSLSVDQHLFTDQPQDVVSNPHIDVVVEVMGGIEPARKYVLEALRAGKHIVTANKDLLALHGPEILEEASRNGCDVMYEASVAGAIPIIKAVTDSLSVDRITKMMGIMNGTTNYILSKMSTEHQSYDGALSEAQALGFAEADPTADVSGMDAARKMAILSTLGFDMQVELADVDCRGIEDVDQEDIAYAHQLGYEIKLLGLAARDEGGIEVSVQPAFVHRRHPLAAVQGEYNAVYVYGEAVGETMFYGPGAGEHPTAAAVVSDVVGVVHNLRLGTAGKRHTADRGPKVLKNDDRIYAQYFLRLHVRDEVGVLAQLTGVLAQYGVSMEQVFQQPVLGTAAEKKETEHQSSAANDDVSKPEPEAEVILITHKVSKQSIEQVLATLQDTDILLNCKSLYRVEGGQS